MKKEISLENLTSLLINANGIEDVLTFFNEWRQMAATNDVRMVRREIVAKCNVAENYVFAFCSNPGVLYPNARQKYLPTMQKKIIEILKAQANEAAERSKILTQIVDKVSTMVC